MIRLIRNYKMLFSVATLVVLLISCANMGSGPQGGPYDFDAPVLIKSNPQHNATNFSGNKIELLFNENVVVKEPNNKVIVTPPQKLMPIIRPANKKVTIELRDTLKPNTTYTIDFTDAIQDNNQDNPLENFSLSFSTGDVVDSLTVSGKVVRAEDLEPQKGYYVGLHSNLEDTAFVKEPFLRISRTNDKGEFTIRGIGAGRYHIFALDDKNRDYTYDNPMEALGFFDAVLEPSSEHAVRQDTVFADEEQKLVDSIKTVNFTKFLPDNIIIKTFLSAKKREYFRSAERQVANKFALNFGSATQKPTIEPLNFDSSIDWSIAERNISRDSVYTYWIKDESISHMDTLLFSMTYNMTDTLNNLITTSDTLRVVNRERKDRKKDKKKNDEEEELVFLDIKSNIKGTWDVYDNIELEFSEPIKDSLRSHVRLQQKQDTTFQDASFNLEQDSLNPRKYKLLRRWKYDEEYKISIDSATVHNIYGVWNKPFEQTLKVKSENSYGRIAIAVSGISDSVPSFIELLDTGGKPIRKARVIDKIAVFRDVTPAKYYVRIVIDANGNNRWDTGEYYEKRQPEDVYYHSEYFEIKAFWEHREEFHVDTLSVSKPLEILKNKPQENSSRQKLLEEQDANKQNQQEAERRRQEELANPGAAASRRRN